MPRYKLTIEYDGTPYHGWQKQPGLPSAQTALEVALTRICQHEVAVFAAGRTDTGVHAIGQVVHVDMEKPWPLWKVIEGANGVLRLNDEPVAVVDCEEVADDFDARFSAKTRHYRYRIINRPANLTVDHERAWHVKNKLDIEVMDKAAKCLIGVHDFTTFRSINCQAKNPVRTLDQLDVRYVKDVQGGREIDVLCSSRAFLHNQVRSMVGSLKLIGQGKWAMDDLENARDAKDRKACGPVAPACGLYLVKVDY